MATALSVARQVTGSAGLGSARILERIRGTTDSASKIKCFDCYPSGSVILAQLGVLGALDDAFRPEVSV